MNPIKDSTDVYNGIVEIILHFDPLNPIDQSEGVIRDNTDVYNAIKALEEVIEAGGGSLNDGEGTTFDEVNNAVDLGGTVAASIALALGESIGYLTSMANTAGGKNATFNIGGSGSSLEYEGNDINRGISHQLEIEPRFLFSFVENSQAGYDSELSNFGDLIWAIVYNQVNGNQYGIRIDKAEDVGVKVYDQEFGKGISYNDWTVDQGNVDWSSEDDVVPSIGLAKQNLLPLEIATDKAVNIDPTAKLVFSILNSVVFPPSSELTEIEIRNKVIELLVSKSTGEISGFNIGESLNSMGFFDGAASNIVQVGEVGGVQIGTGIDQFGATYQSSTDWQNMNWELQDDGIPSIGLIKANLPDTPKRTTLLISATTATQEPAQVSVLLPLNFGAGGSVAEVSLAANGELTANENGTYYFDLQGTFGRTGSGSTAICVFWAQIDTGAGWVDVPDSAQFHSIADSNDWQSLQANGFFNLDAGDKLRYVMQRDGMGANAGGIRTTNVSGAALQPNSLQIEISKLV